MQPMPIRETAVDPSRPQRPRYMHTQYDVQMALASPQMKLDNVQVEPEFATSVIISYIRGKLNRRNYDRSEAESKVTDLERCLPQFASSFHEARSLCGLSPSTILPPPSASFTTTRPTDETSSAELPPPPYTQTHAQPNLPTLLSSSPLASTSTSPLTTTMNLENANRARSGSSGSILTPFLIGLSTCAEANGGEAQEEHERVLEEALAENERQRKELEEALVNSRRSSRRNSRAGQSGMGPGGGSVSPPNGRAFITPNYLPLSPRSP